MKILVVDNHQVMLRFMGNLLEARGHLVKTAEDGLSALKLLRSWVPELMFVDLVMPNISGDKLCQIVRSDHQLDGVNIVILSGIASEQELDFQALGACACIAKGPFDEMASHIGAVLDRLASGDLGEVSKQTLGVDKLRSRQMTRELLESRRHLEVILDNLYEGILELTGEGDVVLASEVAVRLIGRPEEQILGAMVRDLFTAEDRESVQGILTAAGDGATGQTTCEVSLDHRVLSLRAVTMVDGQHAPGHVLVINDITEQRQSEAEHLWQLKVNTAVAGLSETLIGTASSVEAAAQMVLDSALELTASTHGRVLVVDPESGEITSPAQAPMAGSQPPAAHGSSPAPPGGEREDPHPGLWDHLLTREPFFTNSPAPHEATPVAVEGEAEPHNFLAVPAMVGERSVGAIALANRASDYGSKHLKAVQQLAHLFALVVERWRDHEALRESEELFRSLSDASFEGIAITERGRVLDANAALAELLGYERDEMIGQPVSIMVAPQDRELVHSRIAADDEAPYQHRALCKDGSIIHIEVAAAAATYRGRPCRITAIRDITKSKQLEAQLRQSHKMEAIGQLASGIAHDFNNQLAAIMGIAELLDKEVDAPRAREHVKMISNAAQRSADLTRQLLTFARKIDQQAEPLDVHGSILEVTSLLERSLDKRISIITALGAASHTISGDKTQLENALFNLALNARDAMPDGGRLVFSTDVVEVDKQWLSSRPYRLAPGHYLAIAVSDTGMGMDERTQQRVFEPFFTTKEPGRGTGMGLAAVYGTVKSHLGSIEVSSSVGNGSVFTIFLPLAEEQTQSADRAPAETSPNPGARVLVVDDEEMVRTMITEMLTDLGHQVVSYSDGLQAIEYYRQSWHQVDLVIFDLIMPGLGGRQTFHSMREINPDLKALLTTGTSSHTEVRLLLDEGVLGVLEKPYRAAILADTLARVL